MVKKSFFVATSHTDKFHRLFAFVYTLVTPYMINNIGWATFLFWGLANFVIAVSSWFILKETRGLSLEKISADAYGFEDMLQTKLAAETPSISSGHEAYGKGTGRIRAQPA